MANSKKKATVTKSAGKLAKNPKMAANKSESKSTRAAAPVWTTVGTAGEEIADEAYKRKKSLVQVEVAEGVTKIGSGAFSGCVNLESVKIPKSVTRIGSAAFRGCSKLQNVIMAEGLETIGDEAFLGCTALTTVSLPKSVVWLRSEAFGRCGALESLVVRNDKLLSGIGEAFPGCGKLPAIVKKGVLYYAPVVKGSVAFPGGVTSIADSAFRDNAEIKRIVIPAGVRRIGEYAFCDCKNLVAVDIPDTVVEIERASFRGCKSLKQVKLPSCLKKLGYDAFSSCEMLAGIEVPSSVKELGSGCFECCARLKGAVILAKIKELPYNSFRNCSALTSVSMPEVSEIGSGAFEGCRKLKTFDFSKIREIEYDAFEGCVGLKSISFSQTLQSVGRGAFKGCANLVRVIASHEVLKKLNYASVFKGCASLPPLVVDGVLRFMPVSGDSVAIPAGVTEISNNLFEDCKELKSVVFPASLRKIGESSFNATGIESLELPSGLLEIGEEAFRYCKALKALTIPGGVKVVERLAFGACSQLATVKLAEGVERIGDGAFAVCKNLKEIVIPASVKEIEDEAFVACVGLDRISFASGETSVDKEAFKQCVVIRKVEVPIDLQEGCALLGSRGYKAIWEVADRNAKYGDDVELKTAELELWSYSPTIGTAWVDSLDEVDDDLAECARDEGGGWGALDVSDIGGELKINGEDADIDFKHVRRVEAGVENTWSEFRDKIGIYSVDIDKADCSTIFAIAGDFDPKKLTLYYKTAIGPGYYKHPEDVTMDLLDRVEYDGVELDLDYGGDRNNKGCMFTVFNEGKYAKYELGCAVEDLDWENFPGGNNWACFDLLDWAEILSAQPQFADKCDKWGSFKGRHWSQILARHPQFADRCGNWDSFDGGNWSHLLAHQPQFADKCDSWRELGVNNWAELIAAQPQFSDKCDKWEIFDDDDWAMVLSAQPQLFDRFKSAHAYFHGGAWLKVLQKQPQLAMGKVDWRGGARDARNLIVAQPQFANQCEKYEYMDDIDLALLASANLCEDRFLKVKNPSSWAVAIALAGNPQLARKIQVAKVLDEVDEDVIVRLLNDDDLKVTPWASPAAFLLRNQPTFLKDIDTSKFTCEDWLCVLQKQPQLSDKCDWKRIETQWDGDSHATYLDNGLISLIRENTDIDVTEGIDLLTFISSPLLMKFFFDSDDWRNPSLAWRFVLCRYPEMASDFERDHFTVKEEEPKAVTMQDERVRINFHCWNDWGESKWSGYEQKLAQNDESINEQFDEQWVEALEDCEAFDQIDFLSYACKRNPCWSILISWEWGCIIENNPSLLNCSVVRERIVKWCDECDESDGYYEDDDCCSDEDGGTLNRWAYVLSVCPQLAPQCKTYQKFNGYSRCMLIAKQPQFAEKFSLDELGDPDGACWSTCNMEGYYTQAWETLANAHPEFAKYRKG